MDCEFFKKLTPSMKAEFRKWARDNYKPGDKIPEIWHPETRQECEKMNCEQVDKQEGNPQ